MNKVNIFYPMDKGFFGKTLCASTKKCAEHIKPSKIELDSVDDLIKHFHSQMFSKKIDRTPKVDTFSSADSLKKSDDCFSSFSQFFGLI